MVAPLRHVALFGAIATLVGCASEADYRKPYFDNKLEVAEAAIHANLAAGAGLSAATADFAFPRQFNVAQGDQCLMALEKGMLCLAQSQPDLATRWFEQARQVLDARFHSFDVSDLLATLLIDDMAADYQPADYELVLVNFMAALSELVGGGVDAYAYSSQIGRVQTAIAGSDLGQDLSYEPRKLYKSVAVGAYLQGIVQERRGHPDALTSFKRAQTYAGGAVPVIEDAIARLEGTTTIAEGHGVLHVFYLAGPGPDLTTESFEITPQVQQIAQTLLQKSEQQFGAFGALPVKSATPAAALGEIAPLTTAVVGSATAHVTHPLMDVNLAAAQYYSAMRPLRLAAKVARFAIRAVAAKQATDEVSADDIWGLVFAAGAAVVERDDLRNWKLLPASIQATRIELPIGAQQVRFDQLEPVTVNVDRQSDTYAVVLRPKLDAPPIVLVSANGFVPELAPELSEAAKK